MALFGSCQEAATIIESVEKSLYNEKVLDDSAKYPALPDLERLIFELASDVHLTKGAFYSLTISVNDTSTPGKQKELR